MKQRRIPLELIVLLYLLLWIPFITLNRGLAVAGHAAVGHAISGLQILPVSLIGNGVFTWLFMWLAGWWRSSPLAQFGPLALPRPTRWTMLSGIGAGLLLIAVPLSYTFAGVSIPFMQLLMRGDVLIIAPVIDLATGRRVRASSWAALVLVSAGLVLTIRQRGGLHLPPLCWATIALYIAGYFLRLLMMSRVAKNGEPATLRCFFAQEQIVATPVALAGLALVAAFGPSVAAHDLRLGFWAPWTVTLLPWLTAVALLTATIGVLSAVILLDERENTYCVPFERAASILGGLAAAYALTALYNMPAPTPAELGGAGLLICAVVMLALAPRLAARRRAARATLAGADRP